MNDLEKLLLLKILNDGHRIFIKNQRCFNEFKNILQSFNFDISSLGEKYFKMFPFFFLEKIFEENGNEFSIICVQSVSQLEFDLQIISMNYKSFDFQTLEELEFN